MTQNPLALFYAEQKRQILEVCRACGVCAQRCPVIPHTTLTETPPRSIQQEVKAFLRGGDANETAYTRAFACMECFQCEMDGCPRGLSPLRINEIVKQEYQRRYGIPTDFDEPAAPDSSQRILASIQVDPETYRRLLTPSNRERARYVFFPGCNVYSQPEKILQALDILAYITDDVAFVPGLDFCCGEAYLFAGKIEQAGAASSRLVQQLAAYQPETVIFWCPTCLCRFNTTLAQASDLPFAMQSFPQFLAEHMDQLPLRDLPPTTVTLHEACKAAFTGLDLTGAREVLQKIGGIRLVEMERHGEKTACCGSGAAAAFPASYGAVRDERLREAAATGADVLVDVCHFCHATFAAEAPRYGYRLANYVTLAAQALGIARPDTLLHLMQSGDVEGFLEGAAELVEQSPFSRERIRNVLQRACADNR